MEFGTFKGIKDMVFGDSRFWNLTNYIYSHRKNSSSQVRFNIFIYIANDFNSHPLFA